MLFASLLGGPRRASDDQPRSPGDDFWYGPVGVGNQAGIRVTPDLALKAAALYACIKVLAETLATLPCQMFRTLPNGNREPAPDHPLDDLIRFQPNGWQTAVEFWEMLIMHAALRGTGYAEVVPGRRGFADQLEPLHTDRVEAERLRDKTLRFKVTDPQTGKQRYLLQEEMFRIPGMSSDGVTGLRAVDLAAEDLGLGIAADAYAARVFSNNLNIGGYLIHPGKLSEAAQKTLIQALMEKLAGVYNAHRPVVLQEGMKFEKATFAAEEAQLKEAREFQIKLIAMRWRIPLFMLGIEQRGADSEQQANDFVKYTLRPWVRRIEQAIRRDLILAPQLYEAKFNLDALLRGDSKSRADYFSKALGSGGSPAWMTQNEVRDKEGLPRIEDPRADTLGVGTNPDTSEPRALADDTPLGRAGRLVKKEIAAITKAAMRFAADPDGFRAWLKAFYAGHVSATMQVLGVSKDVARLYCAHARSEVGRANDVAGLMDRWEAGRAQEIADIIAKNRPGDPDPAAA